MICNHTYLNLLLLSKSKVLKASLNVFTHSFSPIVWSQFAMLSFPNRWGNVISTHITRENNSLCTWTQYVFSILSWGPKLQCVADKPYYLWSFDTISSGNDCVNTVSFAWHFVLFGCLCLLKYLSEKVNSPLGPLWKNNCDVWTLHLTYTSSVSPISVVVQSLKADKTPLLDVNPSTKRLLLIEKASMSPLTVSKHAAGCWDKRQ